MLARNGLKNERPVKRQTYNDDIKKRKGSKL